MCKHRTDRLFSGDSSAMVTGQLQGHCVKQWWAKANWSVILWVPNLLGSCLHFLWDLKPVTDQSFYLPWDCWFVVSISKKCSLWYKKNYCQLWNALVWHIYCKKTHCKKTTKFVTSWKFEYTLALLWTTCSNTKEWHISPFGTFLSLLVWWSTPQVWCCLHLKILILYNCRWEV
jgi:hypothetical protein